MVNFSKQERFAILKSNQKPKKSTKRFTRKFVRSMKSAARSINIKKGFTGANWEYVYSNLNFGLTSTKLEKWIEIWHRS